MRVWTPHRDKEAEKLGIIGNVDGGGFDGDEDPAVNLPLVLSMDISYLIPNV